MKIKRIFAYLFDIILVSFIASLVFALFTNEQQAADYEELYTESTNLLLNAGSGEINEDELIDLTYRMQIATKASSIINIGLLIIYFGVASYLMKGQTLGKKIFHIKVVSANDKDLNPSLYMLRAILVTNFIPKLVNIISLMLCSKETWYQISNISSNASTIIIFLIVGFMIFRDDERGLHDIICQTKVIETNKKE